MIAAHFLGWKTFHTQLLFDSFIITEPWQFALTWFAVVLTVVAYCCLQHVIQSLDASMENYLRCGGASSADGSVLKFERPVGWQTVKFVHAALSALKYGLSLMLMLIAMTFNPSLFLALVVGSLIGEYIRCDFQIDLVMGDRKKPSRYDGMYGRLIQRLLCARSEDDNSGRTDSITSRTTLLQKVPVREMSSKMHCLLWSLPRMISTICVIVAIVWVIQAEGNFGFDSISVFGWHALCMTLFVGVFMNEAVLTYKVPLFPQLGNERNYLRYVKSFYVM